MAEIFGQTSILWILCVLQNLLQLIGLLQKSFVCGKNYMFH
jgi:hypothetical protein